MEMVSVSLIDRDTYTYLEGMLGWLSVRRMIITVTMRTPEIGRASCRERV